MGARELLRRFLECAVHTALHSRQLYQPALFEQRRFLGITVWQCRHPDVLAYIQRVFSNFDPLFRQGVVEKVVMVVLVDGKPWDHVVMKCECESADTLTKEQVLVLEEELRSTILRLSMMNSSLGTAPLSETTTWQLMVVTKPTEDQDANGVLSQALTSGEWMVDNNQSSESVLLAAKVNARSLGPTSQEAPTLVPLKSYRDEAFNMSVYAHSFHGTDS